MSCFRQSQKASETEKIPFFRKATNRITCFGPGKEDPGRTEHHDGIRVKNESLSEPARPREVAQPNRTPEPPKPTRAEADRVEFGLKSLYDCDNAEVDIVAVHGLNGHRVKTFTATNGICWLDSLLPKVLPKIRVLSYGYDARTHSSSPLSREHLHGHAEQLVEKLTRTRRVTKTTNRPIIFIAHSLGGIIVKSALILSASFNTTHLEAQKGISLSTFGILFMGTPHAGGGGVTWGRLALNLASIVKHTNVEFLDVLERNSQWLEQQQVHYNSISSRFDTTFFYETYETLIPGGGTIMIVPRHSACIPGARDSAVIAISSDHRGMVRFGSAEEDGFLAVVETLAIMLESATQKIDANWQEWETIKAIGEAQNISYSVPMNLPFQMNRNFTGREQELLQIHEVLQGASQERIAVLHGLGGIGKTQIATQYAYSYSKDYTSVWWVSAGTTASLSHDFLKIAQELIMHHARVRTGTGQKPDYSWIATLLGMPPGAVDQTGRLAVLADTRLVVEAVRSWLADPGNQKWLLVVDNYDDLENVNLADFLPTSSSGNVIITSRARDSQRLGKGLEVEEIQQEDGIELLRKSAATRIDQFERERTDAIIIVQKLGGLPLALDQAGAYINSVQISYNQYLERFESAFAKIAAKRPPKSVWQYREDTLFTTWEISFAALRPGAQELLLLCGFLDNEDIWEGLLPVERMKESFGIESVDDAIEEMFSLSLAKRKNLSDGFWIHSMVHKWSQERLPVDKAQQEAKASLAVSLTSAALSFNDDRQEQHNLALERRLMPHIKACSHHVWRDEYLEFADLAKVKEVETLTVVLFHHWELDHAEMLIPWVLAAKESALGEYHPDTLTTVCNMASVFNKQGNYTDALDWYWQAYSAREEALGKDHPDTLCTIHNLATTLHGQGKYDDALEWFGWALSGREETLGKHHPDTLATVSNIALVFKEQGEYGDAVEWFARAISGQENALREGHPDALIVVSNMASLLEAQGRYDDALEWYERALVGQEKALGKDHPETLATVNNMATLFGRQGRHDDALEWYGRALSGKEKALGKDHPSTLATVGNMAMTFFDKGRYADALEWSTRSVVGVEKILGKDNPDTLAAVCNTALILDSQGMHGKALEWYSMALTRKERTLGRDHVSTLTTVNNMASVFENQGKYDDAVEWYGRALAGRENALGADHPDTLATISNMASVFANQQKHDYALEWYRRALVGKEKALGNHHPSTLATIHNMATLFYDQGKYTDAIEWFERALRGLETTLGVNHPDTLGAVGNMASVYEKYGNYADAHKLYERELNGQEKNVGGNHPNTNRARTSLTRVIAKMESQPKGETSTGVVERDLGEEK